jgi:hypothetical protein
MDVGVLSTPPRSQIGDWKRTRDPRDRILTQFSLRPRWAYSVTIAATLLLFISDDLLPRGATTATGYCSFCELVTRLPPLRDCRPKL